MSTQSISLGQVLKMQTTAPTLVLAASSSTSSSTTSTFTSTSQQATSSPTSKNKQQIQLVCTICLDEIDLAQRIFTKCFHSFHENCLNTWLDKYGHDTCPWCRTKDPLKPDEDPMLTNSNQSSNSQEVAHISLFARIKQIIRIFSTN